MDLASGLRNVVAYYDVSKAGEWHWEWTQLLRDVPGSGYEPDWLGRFLLKQISS